MYNARATSNTFSAVTLLYFYTFHNNVCTHKRGSRTAYHEYLYLYLLYHCNDPILHKNLIELLMVNACFLFNF